jgi:hypothetical protein
MPDDRKGRDQRLRLSTNDELQKLVESRETSGYVTMLHPLELFMARDLLEAITRESLDAIRSKRKADETPAERLAVERAIQQRVDFLSWLVGQPEQIYMAMYPAELDGLDDLEDLQDLLELDDDSLPF